MSEQTKVVQGAVVGAVVGACASYLFFTERGRTVRERFEPMVDDLKRDFGRFQKTIEKFGELANDGMRMVNEFNQARSQYSSSSPSTSH